MSPGKAHIEVTGQVDEGHLHETNMPAERSDAVMVRASSQQRKDKEGPIGSWVCAHQRGGGIVPTNVTQVH